MTTKAKNSSSNQTKSIARKSTLGVAKAQNAPIAKASTIRQTTPLVQRLGANMVRIHHREFIANILGSTAFTVTPYSVNPGDSTTFPWLSTQALAWQHYHFKNLKFEYITRTATTTVGTVILAPDYDPSNPPPSSEAVITAYMDSVEDSPWKNFTCTLSPAAMFPIGPRKYIRSTYVPGSQLNTYDAANLFVATVGEVGSDSIGKLWVEYTVDLFVPQLNATGLSGLQNGAYLTLSPAGLSYGYGAWSPFTWDATISNSLNLSATDLTAGIIQLPKGNFFLCLSGETLGGAANTTDIIHVTADGNQVDVPQRFFNLANEMQGLNYSCVVQSDGDTVFQIAIRVNAPMGASTPIVDTATLTIMPI